MKTKFGRNFLAAVHIAYIQQPLTTSRLSEKFQPRYYSTRGRLAQPRWWKRRLSASHRSRGNIEIKERLWKPSGGAGAGDSLPPTWWCRQARAGHLRLHLTSVSGRSLRQQLHWCVCERTWWSTQAEIVNALQLVDCVAVHNCFLCFCAFFQKRRRHCSRRLA